MRYYPVFLDLVGRRCIVVGGGKVAERKVRTLIKAGACVLVISPDLTKGLIKLKREKRISYRKDFYQKKLIKKAFLVIAATDNKKINSRISYDCNSLRIPVNVVDSPELSSFICPAVLSKGDLTFAISSSGFAPSLSKKIKIDLRRSIIPKYSKFLSKIKYFRKDLKLNCPDNKLRRRLLRYFVNSNISKI
ncbi:MAG: bifunctional precorrin-2 dehydrogenase/sirohydrochlorin ferrochelatase [Candidatus Omnitrophica bacterium]|nr:bifunctional precorrin-2 dehydrogenase/sirohydrochlorin ferrochelatase [Candidatus Omnitrophota bacterium]